MNTFTSNDAKQKFGEVIELALQEPVSITRHGRPSVVVTSDADYRELLEFKYSRLQEEVAKGFDSFKDARKSSPSVDEIAAKVLKKASKH
ncbi:type II toxin-antitoxin system prevent-host-death family antitoxin [Luteolibacter flavescens]|uniref:Antitoxin n=1 Tax=Luteolibacter flavescens TaxID=1859460 RepID=A0ABT3FIT4_9BACT|nr:type II toxin-antitoxin system prevent-host-death family antitoxin [Luteolibacter flavescens]MCW1883479.1 type II toxin-antitoxin system prevent-host-death family antitoxin [Luteolibacter flavescens]